MTEMLLGVPFDLSSLERKISRLIHGLFVFDSDPVVSFIYRYQN